VGGRAASRVPSERLIPSDSLLELAAVREQQEAELVKRAKEVEEIEARILARWVEEEPLKESEEEEEEEEGLVVDEEKKASTVVQKEGGSLGAEHKAMRAEKEEEEGGEAIAGTEIHVYPTKASSQRTSDVQQTSDVQRTSAVQRTHNLRRVRRRRREYDQKRIPSYTDRIIW
jgi:hypothetical protein